MTSRTPGILSRLALLSAATLLLFSACGQKNDIGDKPGSETPDASGGSSAELGSGGARSGGSDSGGSSAQSTGGSEGDEGDELFDAHEVAVFSITIAEDRWETMKNEAYLEIYEEGLVTYNGTEVGNVGVRFKGGFGTLLLCAPRGALDPERCNKLSMKLKFNKYDPDLRFFGMKRLNFHGMQNDGSMLREKIAYKVFRDSDILAPRAAWARLEVNGESFGLFAMVEQIDGRFTANRWPEEGDGNLFKSGWPVSDVLDDYTRKLRTNEDQADGSTFLAFRNALYGAAPAERLEELGRWVDLDQFYRYAAVDEIIKNFDGFTGFYCGLTDCTRNHNYFMYQHELEDKFTLVPWDLDYTLNSVTAFDPVPHWTAPGDCSVRYPVWNGAEAVSAGCDPVFQALNQDQGRFADAIEQVLEQSFDPDQIRREIDDYVNLIAGEMEKDPTVDSLSEWRDEVAALKSELDVLKALAVERANSLR